MKKLFAILFGIAVLTVLVLTPPGETIKMYEEQSIETVSVDVINIDGIELQSAEIIYPIENSEVGISPYYVIDGVNYTEFSRYNYISNDDTYAINYDDPTKGANRLYGTNYFLHNYMLNNESAISNYTKSGTNNECYFFYNSYKEVGITTGVTLWHCNDATT